MKKKYKLLCVFIITISSIAICVWYFFVPYCVTFVVQNNSQPFSNHPVYRVYYKNDLQRKSTYKIGDTNAEGVVHWQKVKSGTYPVRFFDTIYNIKIPRSWSKNIKIPINYKQDSYTVTIQVVNKQDKPCANMPILCDKLGVEESDLIGYVMDEFTDKNGKYIWHTTAGGHMIILDNYKYEQEFILKPSSNKKINLNITYDK